MDNMQEREAHLVMRRLSAAEGYLQLGMPQNALEEIDGIVDVGPFSPPRDLLRGEALRQLERYDEAIETLEVAARTVAPQHRPMAWSSLIECFRARGETQVADLLEHATQTPGEWEVELPHGLRMQIVVHVVSMDRAESPAEFDDEIEWDDFDMPFDPAADVDDDSPFLPGEMN